MQDRFDLINVALGTERSDIMIQNVNLVNVLSREVNENYNVLIKGNRIAYVGEDKDFPRPKRIIDAKGKYVLPGLMDGHMHIESTCLTPNRLSEILLPLGTTSIFIDPHEFCNIAGVEGLNFFLGFRGFIGLKIFVELPSDVPFDPEFSSSGGEINFYDIQNYIEKDGVIGLGEVMNYRGVLKKDPLVLNKLLLASKARLTIEGHAVGLVNKFLNAYIAAGIESDHESYTEAEVEQKIRLGMTLEIRHGSYAKNLSTLLKPIINKKLDTSKCILVTDDIHILDIIKNGHINYLVSLAIKEGMDYIDAVKMATINTARHFKIDYDFGSISPGKIADILILSDLENMKVKTILTEGIELTKKNIETFNLSTTLSPKLLKTINIKKKINEKDCQIKIETSKKSQEVVIIDLNYPHSITKKNSINLPLIDGVISVDPPTIAKCIVLERHKKTGNKTIGFVKGFNILEGAFATSISHDSHNLIAIGADDLSICTALNHLIDLQGGIVVSNKKEILTSLKLNIGGLMSDDHPHEVAKKLEDIDKKIKSLGVIIENPVFYLSFLTLTAIPEIRITDKGIVDTVKREFLSIFP